MLAMRLAVIARYFTLEDPQKEEERGKFWPQFNASLVGALTNLGIGAVIGFPGVTFPHLTHPQNHDIFLNQMEIELFGSLAYLGSIFGCIVSGILMVWYGQRKSMLIVLPLALVGWILLGIGSSIWMLQVARLLLGIYVGFGYTCAGNYVTEIAHHSIRGQLSSLVNIFRQLGFIFIYGLGSTDLTWRHLAWISGGITVIGPFLGLLCLPDSPRWLVSIDKIDEAKKILTELRGNIYDVNSEMQLIVDQHQVNKVGNLKDQMRELANPMVLNRLILLAVLFILFSLTGNCPVVTYSATIFTQAHNYLDKYKSTIIIGAFRTLGAAAFLIVGDKFSRRGFTELAMLAMAVCMLTTGFYFYLKDNYDVSPLRWIPLSALSVHQFFVLFNPINFLPSELLPTSVRAVGTSIVWMTSFLIAFVIVFTFPIMNESIGLHGTFWTYAFYCFVFYIVTALYLPESGGIALEALSGSKEIPREETEPSDVV